MEFEHLPRAPIQEAVLDVRVRARSDLSAEAFQAAYDRIKADYPTSHERRQFQVKVDPSKKMTGEAVFSVDGYRFEAADGLDVVQFWTGGFSINRLRPYKGWDHFFPKFERLWPLYLEIARPISATRIAARCINVMPAEREGGIDQIFTAPLEIPAGIEGSLNGFHTSATLTDSAARPPMSVTLQTGLQLAADGRSAQFLLDVDAFTLGEFDLSEVISLFARVHRLRNQAFFRSLTSQAIERFR
ncbi:MAG TPA: TIGR04255 family protein [Gemmatimonadaceae bacterium]|jgi:uncharacterized protein (TIGR04255 family)